MSVRSLVLILALFVASPATAQTVMDYTTAHDLISREAFVLMNRNLVPTGWRFVPFEGGTPDVKSQLEVQIPDYSAPVFVPSSPQALYDFWHANLPAAIDALMVKWRAGYTILGLHAYNTPLWRTLRIDGPLYDGTMFIGPSIRSRYRVDTATGAHVLRLDLLAGN